MGRNPPMFSTPIFDRECLEMLDLSHIEHKFNPQINLLEPGPGLYVRPLELRDFDAGYVDLLSELTEVGLVNADHYEETFERMRDMCGTYFIAVIEDQKKNAIVGAGTLLIERKFIHSCGLRGRLEDIVVSERYRGRQLGKVLIYLLTELARSLNCYKVTLECNDSKREFYESFGYVKEENNSNFMQMRFYN